MANTITLEHPDFVKNKLGVMKISIVTNLLYDGKKVKANLKKQFKILDDHGQERICKFKTTLPSLTPNALIIDDSETIPFEIPTQIPKLAYVLLVPNILFLVGGAVGGAIAAVNILFILGLFGRDISNPKRCLCSILSTSAAFLFLGVIAHLFTLIEL